MSIKIDTKKSGSKVMTTTGTQTEGEPNTPVTPPESVPNLEKAMNTPLQESEDKPAEEDKNGDEGFDRPVEGVLAKFKDTEGMTPKHSRPCTILVLRDENPPPVVGKFSFRNAFPLRSFNKQEIFTKVPHAVAKDLEEKKVVCYNSG